MLGFERVVVADYQRGVQSCVTADCRKCWRRVFTPALTP